MEVLPNMTAINTTMAKEAVNLGNEIFSNAKPFFSQVHCFQNEISYSKAFIWVPLTICIVYLQLEVAFNKADSSLSCLVA